MKHIAELMKERPHLESPLSFYRKVLNYKGRLDGVERRDKESTLRQIMEIFCEVFSLPFPKLEFIIDEVKEKGIDPFDEPSSLLHLDFYHDDMGEEEKRRALFLISKPFFIWLRKSENVSFYESGRCPVCGNVPSLGRINEENRKVLLCSFCEFEGGFYRIGCPNCNQKEGEKIDILLDEDEIRVELCRECRSYIKSMTEEHIRSYGDPYLVDIISLPLDVIAQKRGFLRRSPNLIGIQKIL